MIIGYIFSPLKVHFWLILSIHFYRNFREKYMQYFYKILSIKFTSVMLKTAHYGLNDDCTEINSNGKQIFVETKGINFQCRHRRVPDWVGLQGVFRMRMYGIYGVQRNWVLVDEIRSELIRMNPCEFLIDILSWRRSTRFGVTRFVFLSDVWKGW